MPDHSALAARLVSEVEGNFWQIIFIMVEKETNLMDLGSWWQEGIWDSALTSWYWGLWWQKTCFLRPPRGIQSLKW